MPVLNWRKVRNRQGKFREAKEAMSEDDGVLWGFCDVGKSG